MEPTTSAALWAGLGLGGVVAVAAAWCQLATRGLAGGPQWPMRADLAVGGIAAVAIAAGQAAPAEATPLVVAGLALAAGVVTAVALERSRSAGLGDLPGLAAVVALVAVLTPTGTPVLPTGPLGGQPTGAEALAAIGVGMLVATMIGKSSFARSSRRTQWALAGVGTSVVAVLGSGLISGTTNPLLPGITLVTPVDAAVLALRGAVVATVSRSGIQVALAGVGLGLAEGLVRAADPSGSWALAPTVAVATVAVLGIARHRWAAR